MKKRNLVLFGTAAVLSLALAGSLGTVIAASAATITGPTDNGSTTVKYTVADSWTVEIPEEIVINAGGTGTVEASNVKIKPGDELNVTVSSGNSWKVKDSNNHEIDYELKVDSGSALSNGDKVLTVEAGTAAGSANLKATVKEGSKNYSTGGEEYTDTLTFTVQSEAKAG